MEKTVLEKMNIFLVKKDPKPFLVTKESLYEFFKILKEIGLSLYIYEDVWQPFENKEIKGIQEDFNVSLYRFLNNPMHREILEEAKEKNINKIFSFLEAIHIVRRLVLSSEFIEPCKHIIIYIKIDNKLYALHTFIFDPCERMFVSKKYRLLKVQLTIPSGKSMIMYLQKVSMTRPFVKNEGVIFNP